MTQRAGANFAPQLRGLDASGLWVERFEQNEQVHAEADAAIAFQTPCAIPDAVRPALIASIRRFQVGESGDGEQLLRKAARAGDPEYLRGRRAFRR